MTSVDGLEISDQRIHPDVMKKHKETHEKMRREWNRVICWQCKNGIREDRVAIRCNLGIDPGIDKHCSEYEWDEDLWRIPGVELLD